MILGFDAYYDTISEELDRIVELGADVPNLLIASPVGSRMSTLFEFLLTSLLRWRSELALLDGGIDLRTTIAGPPSRSVAESVEGEGDALLGMLAQHERNVDTELDGDDPELSERASGRLDLARRAGLQCAVLRSDIERSLGRPGRIETELAIDGVDERLDVFCAAPDIGGWLGSMCLVALDAPDAWMIEGRGRSRTWRKGRGPAVTAIVGHASDLLLFTWGRVASNDLAVTGDFRVANSWTGVPR